LTVRAAARRCDVASSADVAASVAAAAREFARLDIPVCAAATDGPLANAVELAEEDWNRALAVNVSGVFLVCKHGVPRLAAAGGGSIVIVASQLGQVVTPRRPAYVTSKAALIQLARSLALDHANNGIRVNTVSPGAIETGRRWRRFTRSGGSAGPKRSPTARSSWRATRRRS
jgi:NAD(P)-dependent dehydrogenase (short-subunit alcohol dehydrogenase family)